MNTRLKEKALSFLHLVTSGDVRQAFEQYVAEGFRHHNAYFPGDAKSLMIAMEENAAKYPLKVYEAKRAIEEGDEVAVHGRVQLTPGELEVAVVHIFRFENDRIVELWDVGQPIPIDCPNENGMF